MNVIIAILMEIFHFLTGGRPMIRLRGNAFRTNVTGEIVYLFRDRLARIWMAKGKWSISRTQVYWNPYFRDYRNRPPSLADRLEKELEDLLRKQIEREMRERMEAQKRMYESARRRASTRYASPQATVPTKEFALLSLDPHKVTVNDVKKNFRQASLKCHPDMGGTNAQMHALIEARDKCLAYLGAK